MQIPGDYTKAERDEVQAMDLSRQSRESTYKLSPRKKFLLAVRIINEAPQLWYIFPPDSEAFLAAVAYETSKIKSLKLDTQTEESVEALRSGERAMLAIRVINELPEKAGIFFKHPDAFFSAARYIKRTKNFNMNPSLLSGLEFNLLVAKDSFWTAFAEHHIMPMEKIQEIAKDYSSFLAAAPTVYHPAMQRKMFKALKSAVKGTINASHPSYLTEEFFEKPIDPTHTPKEEYQEIMNKLQEPIPNTYPPTTHYAKLIEKSEEKAKYSRRIYPEFHPGKEIPDFHPRTLLDTAIARFISEKPILSSMKSGDKPNGSWVSHCHKEELASVLHNFMEEDIRNQTYPASGHEQRVLMTQGDLPPK